MKKIALLIISLTLISGAKAQLVRDLDRLFYPTNHKFEPTDSLIFAEDGIVKPAKTDFSFSVGTSYTSLGSGSGFSSSYVAPSFLYAPNERFQMVIGASIGYNSYNNVIVHSGFPSGNQLNNNMGNPTEAFAYGKYHINKNLSLYGYGAYAKNQLYFSPYQAGLGKADYGNFGVGFDYKISEKTSIGASFGFSNGPAFGLSPFGNQFSRPFFP
ncbi:MAG: hypothetical protein JW783_15350 [Bacteroidales bacterium]|nr:hypothetical protein [Bacteroidales bacterium]MBN2750354.1 hypothetical protein [Bacteroidales bacterium]